MKGYEQLSWWQLKISSREKWIERLSGYLRGSAMQVSQTSDSLYKTILFGGVKLHTEIA
jgi:hypothetical protein